MIGLGPLWDRSGDVAGPFWDRSGPFWDRSGACWDRFGIVLGPLSDHFATIKRLLMRSTCGRNWEDWDEKCINITPALTRIENIKMAALSWSF